MRDSPFGRRPSRPLRRLFLWCLVLVVVFATGLVLYSGTSRPVARQVTSVESIGRSTPLEIEVEAGRAGLSSFEVVAQKADGSTVPLAEESFPRAGMLGSATRSHRAAMTVEAERLGLPEGATEIQVFAEDYSPLSFVRPRHPILQIPVQVDLTPPTVRGLGEIRWITRGGSDLALYEVSDDAIRSGVEIGSAFYTGVPVDGLPGNTRASLYALPHDSQPGSVPTLIAEDRAGNRRTVDLPVHIKEKQFPIEDIAISDQFIQNTIVNLLNQNHLNPPSDPAGAFLLANRDLRRTSEAKLSELTEKSGSALSIDGAFRQQPGTRVGSRFAERRTYRYNGQVIDEQTHLGYDLASVQQAPVLAAQAGTVQSVDDLGIYGRSVVLDHGLGLHSLYAHLSSVEVNAGDHVTQGQALGRSGQSGLAAGDHLHFSILVHGTHVDALEWWDPKWVRVHVLEPIQALRPAAASEAAASQAAGQAPGTLAAADGAPAPAQGAPAPAQGAPAPAQGAPAPAQGAPAPAQAAPAPAKGAKAPSRGTSSSVEPPTAPQSAAGKAQAE